MITRLETIALTAFAILPLAAGCSRDEADSPEAKAVLLDAEGDPLGTATLEATEGGVLITVEVEGMVPGEHAFHVHEKGTCDPDEDFSTAGGHFNPAGVGHGMADANADGVHAGDLANLVVDDKGRAVARRFIPDVSLDPNQPDGSRSLLRVGGTAIVIHEGPDDYRTNPAGAAGDRVACGVIQSVG